MPELTDDTRPALVRAIHAAPTMFVLAVTGGGVASLTDLLNLPGASRSILEVVVPYAESSLTEFVGGTLPDGAVSQPTAEAMARAALARARHLAPDHHDLAGVACTAALVTDRPKKGDHRAHLALAVTGAPGGGDVVRHELVTLDKGRWDRPGEDRAVADAVLALIAVACGIQPANGH